MQKENESKVTKYNVIMSAVMDSSDKGLRHEIHILVGDNKKRKYGASRIVLNAATEEILMDQAEKIIRALDPDAEINIRRLVTDEIKVE